jgi:tRNA (adenine57-N1/adenine58-N1)-methyltransferase
MTAMEQAMHAGRAPVIQAGDRVVAFEVETAFRHLLVADAAGPRKHKGLGILDPGKWVGQPWGARLRVADKDIALLRPTLADLAATLARKAQVILPKDASRILFELGIGPGDRVLESGIGSAGLTIPLCWAVGPQGLVVVQELRDEFAEWGRGNVAKAGLVDRLQVHIGDLTQGVAPGVRGPFDAVVLDQPEPWKALPHVVPMLAPGAVVACYTPQVVQMEEAHRALRRAGFADVRQLELIERGWEVKERGSRPSFEGLGHTGFLVFARWLGAPLPPPAPAPAAEEASPPEGSV